MFLFRLAGLAWRSVRRRSSRLVLVALPSALLFGLVTLLVGVEYSLHGIDDSALDARTIRVGAPYGEGVLSMGDVEKIERIPHVEAVGIEEWGHMVHTVEEHPDDAFGAGIYNPHQVKLFGSNIFYVPPDEVEHFGRVKDAVILGKVVADRHHWKVGDRVTLAVDDQRATFLVTYIATRGEMLDVMEIRSGLPAELTGKPTQVFVAFTTVDDPANMPQVKEQLARVFEGRSLESLDLTLADTKSYVHRRSALMIGIFRGTGLLAALLVLGVTLTSVFMSVEERRRELATMRALGYKRGAVGLLVFLEGIFTVLPGVLLGTLATWLYFHDRLIQFGEWTRIAIGWQPVVFTWIVGILLGGLGAIAPALQIAAMQILPGLRDE